MSLTLEDIEKAREQIWRYFHSQGIHLYCPSMWLRIDGVIGCDEK